MKTKRAVSSIQLSLRSDGFRPAIASLLLSTLAVNILSLALPIMTLQVYDRILPNDGLGTLNILIFGVCIAIILEVTLRLCRAYIIGRAGAAYEHRMACKAMNNLLGADLSRLGNYGVAEHMHRMSAVGKLRDFYNGHALTTLFELVFVPIFLLLIWFISGPLMFVPLTIVTAFIAVSFYKGRKLRHALKHRESTDDVRFNFLIESLEGIHTVKAFALEKFFARRYEALEETSTHANYEVTQEMASTFNMGAIFSHLMVASVISAGAWGVLEGLFSSGGLIATLLLSGRMMQPIQKALALWARYQDFSLARDHMNELFSTPQYRITEQPDLPKAEPNGRLSLRDVCFHYGEDGPRILKNINLEMKRGDVITLDGAHGSGKSTLLNLLAGIYPPSNGVIEVDERVIQSYPLERLVKHIGYVRSKPMLFRGTIRDNITCFGQSDERQAKEIAQLLNVDKDVAQLPAGFDTLVQGNHTDSLPAGLMQRIAIVRVLATKPRIILFDNADRTLDSNGYHMIYQLLARLKGKVTMVLISHDENIRTLASRHYILKEGRLEEQRSSEQRKSILPYQELQL